MMFHIVASVYTFSAQAPYFQIFVKGKGSKNITIWAKASDTIDDIKCKIAFEENIPVTADVRCGAAGR